jgi:hypothetical protein
MISISTMNSLLPVRPAPGLSLPSCEQQHHASHYRYRACDGRKRNLVGLFPRRVDWSYVHDLFSGLVGKTAPRETNQTKYDQNES